VEQALLEPLGVLEALALEEQALEGPLIILAFGHSKNADSEQDLAYWSWSGGCWSWCRWGRRGGSSLRSWSGRCQTPARRNDVAILVDVDNDIRSLGSLPIGSQ
jgi:hypothetical protein